MQAGPIHIPGWMCEHMSVHTLRASCVLFTCSLGTAEVRLDEQGRCAERAPCMR